MNLNQVTRIVIFGLKYNYTKNFDIQMTQVLESRMSYVKKNASKIYHN